MIATTILLTMLCQDPLASDWVDTGYDAAHPQAVVVSGDPELSRDEALAVARTRARDEIVESVRARGLDRLHKQREFWVPGFLQAKVLDKWVASLDVEDHVRVLDKRFEIRDHGFGQSYQAHLLLEEDRRESKSALRSLDRRFRRGVKVFLTKCGGTVLLWGFFALLYVWVDRLSRGYMTWRLRVLFSGLGISLPTVAFLLF